MARDEHLFARRHAVKPIAEPIAKVFGAGNNGAAVGGVELGGLEPPAFALPARRSSQLSYSPFEVEIVCKVNSCLLTIARRD